MADDLGIFGSAVPQRVCFDPFVQGQDQRPPETKLAVFLEYGETSESVMILSRIFVGPNGADRNERRCKPQQEMCRDIFKPRAGHMEILYRKRNGMDSNSSNSVSTGNFCSKTSI